MGVDQAQRLEDTFLSKTFSLKLRHATWWEEA